MLVRHAAPLVLMFTPGVLAQTSTTTDYYTYFVTSWIFLGLMLLFYFIVIGMSAPYARPRVPLFLFVVLIFFPPGFLMLLLYLLFVSFLLAPVVVDETPRRRRMPTSRAAIRNA